MSLKNKEIGTSCKKHLKTTIFSAVMPWADPFIFPFIFLDSGLVVFPLFMMLESYSNFLAWISPVSAQ